VLLVSTPNPVSLVRILEQMVYGRTKANVEHTCWYSRQVLDQLALRSGLHVVDEAHIDEMHKYHTVTSGRSISVGKGLARRLLVLINGLVCRVFPQLSETSGFVLARRDGNTAQ
jgi:hypothetical protein